MYSRDDESSIPALKPCLQQPVNGLVKRILFRLAAYDVGVPQTGRK